MVGVVQVYVPLVDVLGRKLYCQLFGLIKVGLKDLHLESGTHKHYHVKQARHAWPGWIVGGPLLEAVIDCGHVQRYVGRFVYFEQFWMQ